MQEDKFIPLFTVCSRKKESNIYFIYLSCVKRFFQKLLVPFLIVTFYLVNLSPAIAQSSDLHQLTNEDLISRSTNTFNVALGNFRAQFRRLKNHESQSQKMKNRLGLYNVSATDFTVPSQDLSTIEASSIKLEYRNSVLEDQKQKLKLLESVLDGLDELIFQLDITQSEGAHFLEKLDSIDILKIEINLRISDGTISRSQVPEILSQQIVNSERDKLLGILEALRKEEKAAENDFIDIVKKIDEIKFAITESEVFIFSEKSKYSREQKNIELEKRYLSLQPQKLFTLYTELWEERKWLLNSYIIAGQRFNRLKKKSDSIRTEYIALSPIESNDIRQSQIEDTDEAIKLMDSLLIYNASRIEKLVEWQNELKDMEIEAERLTVEAIVNSEHVSKMNFLSEILKEHEDEKRITTGSALPENWYAIVNNDDKLLAKQTSRISTINIGVKDSIIFNEQELVRLISTQNEIKIRKSNLERSTKSRIDIERLTSELDSIDNVELLKKF